MDTSFAAFYDAGTSTLEITGTLDRDSWPRVHEEIDRAFRRTACQLTVDVTRVSTVPPHTIGRLVHLCNSLYPGTFVRVARPSISAA